MIRKPGVFFTRPAHKEEKTDRGSRKERQIKLMFSVPVPVS